jgi:hypothetical protein
LHAECIIILHGLYIGFKVVGTGGVGAYLQLFICYSCKYITQMVAKFKDLFAPIALFFLLANGAYRSYNFFLKKKRASMEFECGSNAYGCYDCKITK